VEGQLLPRARVIAAMALLLTQPMVAVPGACHRQPPSAAAVSAPNAPYASRRSQLSNLNPPWANSRRHRRRATRSNAAASDDADAPIAPSPPDPVSVALSRRMLLAGTTAGAVGLDGLSLFASQTQSSTSASPQMSCRCGGCARAMAGCLLALGRRCVPKSRVHAYV
jgi:hypothetical protein